ncbi:hydroxylase [Agromyces sp. CFH 90414]|uniref:Hydroxylase n=1 Tax=Agromyces agglutinans TaxID=2662258 RepID=A0A6I2F1H5_9MICO|nr:fumarylacetoacetate hydrolase family protein [Agromyces agglutinans]MRG58302.1 hydroxylase [Agromyces agglutinans]
MRFARWIGADGVVVDGIVADVGGIDRLIAFDDGMTVLELTRRGLAWALEYGGAVQGNRADGAPDAPTVEQVQLLPPIEPPSVRDFVAFEEHVEGVVRSVGGDGGGGVVAEWYEAPTFYFTNPHSLIGSGQRVSPPRTTRLDFELEVAVVIGSVPGSDGRDLDARSAAAHVFGYTIFNDWSARDLQSREMQVRLGPCKGKDFATTLGPWIVTADAFEDLIDADGFLPLEVEVEVNGVRVGRDLLSNMGWPFAELVAYASRDSRVVPGDVLGSGTTGNGGCLAELWGRRGALDPAPLVEDDVVVMRAERIGEIRNVIGPVPPERPIAPARARSRSRTRALVA